MKQRIFNTYSMHKLRLKVLSLKILYCNIITGNKIAMPAAYNFYPTQAIQTVLKILKGLGENYTDSYLCTFCI